MTTKRNFKEISIAAASSPMNNGYTSRKLTEEAYAQQKEVEAEENAENISMSAFFKLSLHELEDVTDDVDEIEIQSQLDYHVRFFLLNRLCLSDTIYVSHVRTRLYFTSVCVIESETALMEQEPHIHSLMNVLRYCNMDESLQGEESLISQNALFSFFATLEWALLGFYVFLNKEEWDDDTGCFMELQTDEDRRW
ncbi:hypothetical protein IGI04_026528 [Brassica rapa subsp. trilocularis]|uniref:Uncharacterized protein n=1 Tax=Brassica rapa subsp. trilocularis TaxID=1813537 RepID=A0ABQ7KYX5_BRACM|nr:hypothetical protein IGI04_026528 [Brassica rapa subsp. trilocularis]